MTRDSRLSEADFEFFRHRIEDLAGISYPPHRRVTLVARLLPRIAALNLPDLHSYRALLERSGDSKREEEAFINLLTTNKTDFFREPAHFDWIQETLLPEWILQKHGRSTFRAWSAACSTGQEPYSLAITLEDFRSRNSAFDYQILATDIDTGVLKLAANGVYPRASRREIPDGRRDTYTTLGRGELKDWFRFNDSLHQKLEFKPLNLHRASFSQFEPFDLILCRNVFIYFTPDTMAEICRKFAGISHPNGVLLTGHSESVPSATNHAEIGWTHFAPSILRRK
ncbi:MAG: protein-glutamate O-methyltransferase CheR [Bdellovibrionota bacterium]